LRSDTESDSAHSEICTVAERRGSFSLETSWIVTEVTA